MPIFMKYGAIKGAATASGHEGWIELNSFQLGVGRSISGPGVGSSGRGVTAPSISEIVVTKPTDIATVALLQEALVGGGQDVSIDFCTTSQGTITVYLSYTLTNTMISGNSINSSGDLPEESISWNFTRIQCRDLLPGAQNPDGSPASIGYDLTTAKTF